MKSDVPTNFYYIDGINCVLFTDIEKITLNNFFGLLFYAIQQQRNEMAISVFYLPGSNWLI